MKTIRKRLIYLLGFVVPGSLFAEEENDRDLRIQMVVGGLSSFNQSTGQSPTIEIGVWTPLSIGDRLTTGVYLGHGGAKTTVRQNSLIREGDTPILLTHLLVYHSFELTDSWTSFLEYGFSIIGFDHKETSLSLAGLGFGAGVGYNLWKAWLLTFKTRYVTVNQSYLGDHILHKQLSGSVGLAIPVDLPGLSL